MRGRPKKQLSMLVVSNVDDRVPADHPLRTIKDLADGVLKDLGPSLTRMYAKTGRPSIPPERLLKGMLLIALYSIRSERQLCEQLQYNLLYRWFLDMDLDDDVFDPSSFSHNRKRLMRHSAPQKFFARVVDAAYEDGLMSSEHFSVDGTLIEAWASMKSFKRKDDDDDDSNGWSDFKGKTRKNDTHASKTDPEAKLMRKGNGQEAKLSYSAHALMENRNGLLLDLRIAEANGRAEREVAKKMMKAHLRPRSTLGADASYNTRDFVKTCREQGITPHVAGKMRSSAIDARTTRHATYAASQTVRKRIEQIFGWLKTVAGLRKTRFKGRARTEAYAVMAGAAYNLLRVARLRGATA